MKTIRLGKTHARVPAVSLGTWGYSGPPLVGGASVGWAGLDDRKAEEAIVLAHALGITHWDTADVGAADRPGGGVTCTS
jgi:aryl-alcohol dehydrogenase-like predicted oxidoreductase